MRIVAIEMVKIPLRLERLNVMDAVEPSSAVRAKCEERPSPAPAGHPLKWERESAARCKPGCLLVAAAEEKRRSYGRREKAQLQGKGKSATCPISLSHLRERGQGERVAGRAERQAS